jgi:hypothetical protein
MPNGQLPELGARGAAPGTAYYIVLSGTGHRGPARGYDRQPGAGMKMCTVSSLVFVVLPNRVRAYPVASTGPCTGRSRARAAPTRRRHQTYCGY